MAAVAASEATDGPVMSAISKRLRALRKKLNRIAQMEESVSQGKTLNKEQEEVLRSKPSVLASIDELEKLRPQLASAVLEEHQLVASPKADSGVEKTELCDGEAPVRDLLNLLYFGSLFAVSSQNDYTSTMLTRTHERGCCLTYDYVTDDDSADLLGEKDLDLISTLSSLLISRPADSSLSHRNALQRCIEHATLWLANSEQPIDAKSTVTYAALRERLNKIMASDYFTTTPEMKAPVDVAAAAAAGNYASFQVPVEEPVTEPPQVERSVVEHQEDKDETAAEFQKHEEGNLQPSPPEQVQKEETVVENHPESTVQQENFDPQAEEVELNQAKESKDYQYAPRRNYTGQRSARGGGVGRGSGRRGGGYYTNGRGGRTGGRGGGPYQNGGNLYYEQPGDYYPRSYNNNGRGRGGGGRGGGSYSYSHYRQGGAAYQGGQANADVGVAS